MASLAMEGILEWRGLKLLGPLYICAHPAAVGYIVGLIQIIKGCTTFHLMYPHVAEHGHPVCSSNKGA